MTNSINNISALTNEVGSHGSTHSNELLMAEHISHRLIGEALMSVDQRGCGEKYSGREDGQITEWIILR